AAGRICARRGYPGPARPRWSALGGGGCGATAWVGGGRADAPDPRAGRRAARLGGIAAPGRAAPRDRSRTGVARVRVVIVAVGGAGGALAFARAARRYTVSDRLRGERRAGRRRLPSAIHEHLARALDAAAIDVTPERSISTWCWSITVAAAL